MEEEKKNKKLAMGQKKWQTSARDQGQKQQTTFMDQNLRKHNKLLPWIVIRNPTNYCQGSELQK